MDPGNQSVGAGVNGGQLNPYFVLAAKRILRPLVRLFLARGVTYPYLADLLKGIYVGVASQDFALAGKRQTDSRLSLITGVHRKDVRRLAHQEEDPESVPDNLSLGNRLITRWCSDPTFLDYQGKAMPLPRLEQADGGPSFEGLVAAESKDIRARAVLDEWVHLGRVVVDAMDRVCLRTESFVPAPDYAEKVYFLGHNLHDHIAAAAANMLDKQPPFMERSVSYARLPRGAVQQLSELAERLGMEALRTVDRRALQMKKAAAKVKDGDAERMTFGIYFYEEASVPSENARDQSERSR